jgi:hypothetical protein
MKVEFLTKPDCEPSELMHPRVTEALGPVGFATVDVTALPPDDARRGYDTPTVLVDGADAFGSVPRADLSAPPS